MKLIDFLKTHALDDETFAVRIGGKVTARAVRKWKYGETRPRLPELARIEAVTEGAVRLADFVDTSENGAAA